MGHTPTRFVPPYPSQCQSQGTNRGRGQDFQASTLETQGRVYTVISQAELAYQSDIQGMFLLSRLWARLLFDSIAYACDVCVLVCVNFRDEILLKGGGI